MLNPHCVHEKTYLSPTYCAFCTKLLVGIVNQGYKCESIISLIYVFNLK